MGILKILYRTINGNKELLFLRVCVLHFNYTITRQVMYILCIFFFVKQDWDIL